MAPAAAVQHLPRQPAPPTVHFGVGATTVHTASQHCMQRVLHPAVQGSTSELSKSTTYAAAVRSVLWAAPSSAEELGLGASLAERLVSCLRLRKALGVAPAVHEEVRHTHVGMGTFSPADLLSNTKRCMHQPLGACPPRETIPSLALCPVTSFPPDLFPLPVFMLH